MAKLSRIHRLLKLLTRIQTEAGWTPTRLAEAFQVDRRTIHRDIEDLKTVGFEITFDKAAQTYRLSGDVFLPPIQLDVHEAMALTVLCDLLTEPEQIAFLGAATRAVAKIQQVMPASVREESERLASRTFIRTAQSVPPDGCADVYATMQEAIDEGRIIECTYDAIRSDADHEPFDFHPYALLFAVRAWYVIGYHAGRDALRTLKLNRFDSLKRTERRFSPPPSFSLDAYLGNAWRMMPADRDFDVEILFDASFADTISETAWHPTQQVDLNDDGSATFRCTVAGLDEIAWWVLSMGRHCRVIQPAELAERVRREAEATAAQYDSTQAQELSGR
jgi:predicted DNA-binding transcriptional regulator YafY